MYMCCQLSCEIYEPNSFMRIFCACMGSSAIVRYFESQEFRVTSDSWAEGTKHI
jgi:hypothetical protein